MEKPEAMAIQLVGTATPVGTVPWANIGQAKMNIARRIKYIFVFILGITPFSKLLSVGGCGSSGG
jgi:hypothetical protein